MKLADGDPGQVEARFGQMPLKIVILSKRRPMGRDLMNDPYGRFFNLSRFLASQGHEVHLALFGFDREPATERDVGGVRLHSCSVLSLMGFCGLRRVDSLIRTLSPEWIIAFSDIYFGVLAEHFAVRYRIKFLVDAYDNFEGYLPWAKPLHWLWRRALQRATAVTAAGPALLELLNEQRSSGHSAVVPMAVDSAAFRPLPRAQCRLELGLPQDALLVGYSGAVAPNRGLETLFDAVELLRRDFPNLQLVMSGRRVGNVAIPAEVVWLGSLPQEAVPKVINSMNVVTVINRLSAFGKHSYPIKLYEAMQCRVPVVASRTPATEWILSKTPELLAMPESIESLAERIRYAVTISTPDYGPLPTWKEAAEVMGRLLLDASADRPR